LHNKLSAYKDLWFFDKGYHSAYTQVIFCIILIFSHTVPLMTLLGFTYFLVKYYIDKYNIIYVFPNEYIGQGVLYKRIVNGLYF